MRTTGRFLAVALAGMSLLAGCSKTNSQLTPPVSPAAPQPPTKPVAAPTPVSNLKGPVYLLETPAKPLWPGWVAVSVENSEDARPQTGLTQADLIVEALAEGSITRFTAYYGSQAAERIGPVRSARQYTVAQAKAFGAPFAHAGGNTDALLTLKNDKSIMNLDEIYSGVSNGFWRSSDRVMPHNLYTSTRALDQVMTAKGYVPKSVPTSPRAALPLPKTGFVERVGVHWSGPNQIAWLWNKEHTAYQRFIGSEPHPVSEAAGIFVPNLVFMEVGGTYRGPEDGWFLDLSKAGKATVVSGGKLWSGRWELKDGEGFRLFPAEGTEVPPLQPGPVWAHLITVESPWSVTVTTP